MQLYANPNNPEHVRNCQMFANVMAEFPYIKFQKPSPDAAPWHVQVIFEAPTGEPMVLNFWPHKGKAQGWGGGPSVEGYDAIIRVIEDALDDLEKMRADRDAFSVVE